MKRMMYLLLALLATGMTSGTLHAAPKDNINLVFIGNSITYGVTLGNPSTQAPPVLCGQLVEQATGVPCHVVNGGHSGITTFGFLPGREDFTKVTNAANALVTSNGGLLYFSIMLGTNDSAISGTEGAPVSTETYRANMKKIIDALLTRFPSCRILVNYPIWYSANTHNGSRYLQEGQDRLHSYYPIIDELVSEYDQVYAGDRSAWGFFEDNTSLFTPENGNSGTFYLHPNASGAARLAEIWSHSLLTLLNEDGIETRQTVQDITLSTGATMQVFAAPEEQANGRAVIICPGGGYAYVAGGYEGADWAPLFNELGYTVAVLNYRLPQGQSDVPLTDGRAALRYLRDHAEPLHLKTNQIGVMGFSAGGHLASTIATHTSGDERPAFQILYYPVITMDSRYTHAGSRENLLGKAPLAGTCRPL